MIPHGCFDKRLHRIHHFVRPKAPQNAQRPKLQGFHQGYVHVVRCWCRWCRLCRWCRFAVVFLVVVVVPFVALLLLFEQIPIDVHQRLGTVDDLFPKRHILSLNVGIPNRYHLKKSVQHLQKSIRTNKNVLRHPSPTT
jgi:hypothetical protein